MKRGRGLIAAGISLISLGAAIPTASASSTTVTSGKISCLVDAKEPTYTRSSAGVVTVTGAYRVTCRTTSTGVTSLSITIAPSVVELDKDRVGGFTVIDTRTELAESVRTVTYNVGSESYKDLTTTSFRCVNTDIAPNDNEELSTRVRISVISGRWTTYDLSTYLSAPC